jgi:hypothetical protein
VSYKPDSPLQVDDVELLFAALSAARQPDLHPNNPNYVCPTNPAARGPWAASTRSARSA